jgi:hypothetical protein
MVLERYIAESYRPDLLKGAAGHLRAAIYSGLSQYARDVRTIDVKTKNNVVVRRWEFIDGLKVDTGELPPVRGETYRGLNEVTVIEPDALDPKDVAAIQEILSRVEKSPVSQLSPSKKKSGVVAQEVSEVVQRLGEVRYVIF